MGIQDQRLAGSPARKLVLILKLLLFLLGNTSSLLLITSIHLIFYLVAFPTPFPMSSCSNYAPCGMRLASTPYHHFVPRITVCLLAELSGFLQIPPPLFDGWNAPQHNSIDAAALPNLLPPLSRYRGEILSPGIIMGPAIFSSPFFTTKGRTRRGAQPEWGW